MVDHFIDSTKKDGPDPDYCIDAFAGTRDDTGGRWRGTLAQVLASIDGGHTFWTLEDGYRAEVIPMIHPTSKRRYVTTQRDGYPPNNLLNLPDCQ